MNPQSQQPQSAQPPSLDQDPAQSPYSSPQQPSIATTQAEYPAQPISQQHIATPAPQQPMAEQATPSDLKKVKILGYSLLITGLLSVVLGVALSYLAGTGVSFDLTYLAAAIQALIGVGLLKHNRIAMYAFNVLAVIALLGLSLLLIVSMLFITAFSGGDIWFTSPFALLFLSFYAAVIGWIVWGLFVLHSKRVRRIFH
jgi:hypothetical protein